MTKMTCVTLRFPSYQPAYGVWLKDTPQHFSEETVQSLGVAVGEDQFG